MRETFISIVLKNFLKITFISIVLCIFLYIMMPFMISIILGGILAMAFAPYVDFFVRRGLSRGMSLVIFSLTLGLVGLVPVVIFFIRGSRMISKILHESNVREIGTKLTASVNQFITHICRLYDLDQPFVEAKFTSFVTYSGHALSDTFSAFVGELPVILMTGLMTTLAVYSFLKESDRIRAAFDKYFFFSKANGERFIHMLKACCREVFFSNIITGILQSAVVSIGALIFDAGDFYIVFFLTFIVSFIPVLGAAPVAAVLGILCFIESRVGPGIGMMVIAAFSGIADNIIRPLLGSLGVVEVHPFIGLLAVVGGVIMFGLPGLFIGPLVASLVFGVIPILADEYFPPKPAEKSDKLIV